MFTRGVLNRVAVASIAATRAAKNPVRYPSCGLSWAAPAGVAFVHFSGRIPTGVVIGLLLILVASSVATVVLQVIATLVALFSNNHQRADRALRVLRTLRGLPDHLENSRKP